MKSSHIFAAWLWMRYCYYTDITCQRISWEKMDGNKLLVAVINSTESHSYERIQFSLHKRCKSSVGEEHVCRISYNKLKDQSIPSWPALFIWRWWYEGRGPTGRWGQRGLCIARVFVPFSSLEFHLFSLQNEATLIVGFGFIVERIRLDKEGWGEKRKIKNQKQMDKKRKADRYWREEKTGLNREKHTNSAGNFSSLCWYLKGRRTEADGKV